MYMYKGNFRSFSSLQLPFKLRAICNALLIPLHSLRSAMPCSSLLCHAMPCSALPCSALLCAAPGVSPHCQLPGPRYAILSVPCQHTFSCPALISSRLISSHLIALIQSSKQTICLSTTKKLHASAQARKHKCTNTQTHKQARPQHACIHAYAPSPRLGTRTGPPKKDAQSLAVLRFAM